MITIGTPIFLRSEIELEERVHARFGENYARTEGVMFEQTFNCCNPYKASLDELSQSIDAISQAEVFIVKKEAYIVFPDSNRFKLTPFVKKLSGLSQPLPSDKLSLESRYLFRQLTLELYHLDCGASKAIIQKFPDRNRSGGYINFRAVHVNPDGNLDIFYRLSQEHVDKLIAVTPSLKPLLHPPEALTSDLRNAIELWTWTRTNRVDGAYLDHGDVIVSDERMKRIVKERLEVGRRILTAEMATLPHIRLYLPAFIPLIVDYLAYNFFNPPPGYEERVSIDAYPKTEEEMLEQFFNCCNPNVASIDELLQSLDAVTHATTARVENITYIVLPDSKRFRLKPLLDGLCELKPPSRTLSVEPRYLFRQIIIKLFMLNRSADIAICSVDVSIDRIFRKRCIENFYLEMNLLSYYRFFPVYSSKLIGYCHFLSWPKEDLLSPLAKSIKLWDGTTPPIEGAVLDNGHVIIADGTMEKIVKKRLEIGQIAVNTELMRVSEPSLKLFPFKLLPIIINYYSYEVFNAPPGYEDIDA